MISVGPCRPWHRPIILSLALVRLVSVDGRVEAARKYGSDSTGPILNINRLMVLIELIARIMG